MEFFTVLERKLERMQSVRQRFTGLGELAVAVNPKVVQTPALDLIDKLVTDSYQTPDSRLIVAMPPQEGKSERVTKTGTLWALLDDPERRIAIASYSQELAEGFGRDIRNWLTVNDGTDGTLDLGLRVAADNGAARRWTLAGHRGGVVAVGLGSSLTGRPVDALIIDDPIKDAEQADSAYYRDRAWDWWTATASTRLAPGAPVILILTRWHEDDLAGRLLRAEDGHLWRMVNIPALADHDPGKGETDPLGREPGEWLESARGRTPEQWQQRRVAVGSRVFNALYQGRPSPETGNVWQRSWWRRYLTPPWRVDGDQRRTIDMDEVFTSWDLTFAATAGSDFVVGQVWGRRGAEVYLLDQVRERMTFTETVAAFEQLAHRWPDARAHLIEDKANGPAVISTLRSKVPGIIPITPKDSKYARASAVSPYIEAGNVLLPEASIAGFDVEGLIDEAAGFPNAAHDDQVDATSQALARAFVSTSSAPEWIAYYNAILAEREQAKADTDHSDQVVGADDVAADKASQLKMMGMGRW